jgi:hypothetical protein
MPLALALGWACTAQPPPPAPVVLPPEPPLTVALDRQGDDRVFTEVPCRLMREGPLVSCAVSRLTSGGPTHRHLFRYARQPEGRWDYLERLSSPDTQLRDLLWEGLEKAGISIGVDSIFTAEGLEQPEVLLEGSWGKLELKYPADDDWDPQGQEVLRSDPTYGSLYGARHGSAALFLPQPEGSYLVYSYVMGSWLREALLRYSDASYDVRFDRCALGPDRYARLVPLREEQLGLLATGPDGRQLFFPKERPSFDLVDFVVWKDPFGRLVELVHEDLQPAAPCEPDPDDR